MVPHLGVPLVQTHPTVGEPSQVTIGIDQRANHVSHGNGICNGKQRKLGTKQVPYAALC